MWNYSMPQDGTIELATYIKMLKYSSCGCAEDIYKSTLGSSYKTVIRKKKKKKKKKKGTTEDEMAGWHHQLDGHEFE